jgi:hypothetical protein
MYYAELTILGYTDASLAKAAGELFHKEIELDEGADDPLTRSRRGLWFKQYTQHAMGPKTMDVPGFVGATVREPPPEPKPYPPEEDIPGAMAWMDAAMDDGSYVSERDLIALHERNAEHWQDFEHAFGELVLRRRAAGKYVP